MAKSRAGGKRGIDKGNGQMGFGHADQRGRRRTDEKLLNAELNFGTSKGNSVASVLKRFRDKYGNADREYGITVDELGYVKQHIKGEKHSVAIGGGKGDTIIHNHPSGSNFSDADLHNFANTRIKSMVATSSNKTTKGTYIITKTDKFKPKEFDKAMTKARWDSSKGYNKGVSEWLKKNAKKYGYTYSHKGVKNADW